MYKNITPVIDDSSDEETTDKSISHNDIVIIENSPNHVNTYKLISNTPAKRN